jgi:hypothetical protein
MSARISKMYKDSGGCKVGKTCGECRYFIPSSMRRNEYICKKHGEEETYWKDSWTACRMFKNPIKKKKTKYKEETTGQLQMVLS